MGRAAVAAGIDSLLSATAADGADAASRREQLLKLVADSIVSGGNHLAAAVASARRPHRCIRSPAVHEQYTASRAPEEQHDTRASSPTMPFTDGVYHSSSASEQHAGPQLPPADGSFWDAQFLVAADDGPWDSREPDCEDPLWVLTNGCPSLAPVDVAADIRNRSSRYDAGGRSCIENGLQRRQQWPGLDGRSGTGDGGLSSHHTGSHLGADNGGFISHPSASPFGSRLPAATVLRRPPRRQSSNVDWMPPLHWAPFCPLSAAPPLSGHGGGVAGLGSSDRGVLAAPADSSGGRGMLAPLWTTADMNAAHQHLQLQPIKQELPSPACAACADSGCAGFPPGNGSAYFLPVQMIQAGTTASTTPALPLALLPEMEAQHALVPAAVGEVEALEKVRREPDRVSRGMNSAAEHSTARSSS